MNSIYTALRMGGPLSGAVGGLFGRVRTLVTRPQVLTALTTTPTTVLGTGAMVSGLGLLVPLYATLGGVIARTKVRNHFPRPSEIKRIRKHGWQTRMATLSGRKILMRRILKGRHVLSH